MSGDYFDVTPYTLRDLFSNNNASKSSATENTNEWVIIQKYTQYEKYVMKKLLREYREISPPSVVAWKQTSQVQSALSRGGRIPLIQSMIFKNDMCHKKGFRAVILKIPNVIKLTAKTNVA